MDVWAALIDRIITQFRLKDTTPISTPMETGLHLSRHSHSPSTNAQRNLMSRTPYQSLVGLLMYLAIGTCPDIAHVDILTVMVLFIGKLLNM